MDLSVLLPWGSAWLATVLLLSLRLGAALALSPLLSASALPGPVRVLLVLGLSAVLSLALPLTALPARLSEDLGALFLAGLYELALGATLGLGIQLAFAAVNFAGRLLDAQVGFGMVQIFDPMSNVRGSVLSTAFDQLAVLMFFLLNIHHVVLRGLAWSLERFPLGQPWPLGNAALPIIKQAGAMFALGIALAAPVVFCILLVELALAVMSHALPQMNMLVIGFPIKIVAGLLALALWVPAMGGTFERIYQSIFQTWNQVLSSAPAAASEGTC